MKSALRVPLTLAAVAFAVAAPALQAGLDLGLSASEFARDGDGTLRAAPFAFSIWSVIYAGMVAYAVWQALPGRRDHPVLRRVGGPAIVAIAGCGAWICASAADWKWASVAIIVTSAASLIFGLVSARAGSLPSDRGVRAFVWWPLGMLAGWLTIASALNILTVATAEGLLDGAPKAAAFAGIVAVLTVGLYVLRSARLASFGFPIAWGLIGVWAGERATKGDVAALAIGAAVLVGTYAAWQLRPSTTSR